MQDSVIYSELKYKKKCPWCKNPFRTNARNQKFCCPEHGKKYNERRNARKLDYNKNKSINRLYSRAHSLAVEVMNQLVRLGLRKRECDYCSLKDKLIEKPLEVHHKDLNWLNATPSNLVYTCKPCHAKEHSELIARLDEQGILVEEFYEPSFYPLVKITNETKR